MPTLISNGAIPRQLIDPPALGGMPPYGLLTAATVTEQPEGHTLRGVEYEALCNAQVDEWPAPCPPHESPDGYTEKTPAGTTSLSHGDPFAVYAADTCLRAGDEALATQYLRDRFLRGEQAAVERVIYHGTLGNRPALRVQPRVLGGDELPDNASGAPPVPEAIGLLEHALADQYGQTGVIHLPRWVGETLASSDVLTARGPRAQSKLGNTYVFGTGYTGEAPTDPSGTVLGGIPDALTNVVWLYATLPVTVRRSGVISPADWDSGAFNTATNQPYTLAERAYVVDWPCTALAVPTSLPRRSFTPADVPEPAPASTTRKTTRSHLTEVSQ